MKLKKLIRFILIIIILILIVIAGLVYLIFKDDDEEINSKNVYDLIISDLKTGSVRDYLNGFLMEVEVVQMKRAR